IHEAELRAIVAQWAAGLSRAEALARLRGQDVPSAPVWSLDETIASGQLEARGLVQPGVNGVLGDIRVVPQPVRFSDADIVAPMRSP
ncbi:CoA transferase, partial [Rhodoplanes serenus]